MHFLMCLPHTEIEPLLKSEDGPPLVNVGCGTDMTVAQIAELIADVVDYRSPIVFDSTKPDRTPQKLLDTGRLTSLGWRAQTSLRTGLIQTYRDFCSRTFDCSREVVISPRKM